MINNEAAWFLKLLPVASCCCCRMPWLPRQVVLIFTAATFLGLGTFSQQTCKCATVKKDNTASWDKKHNNHDRIVGGYDTKQNKPWVARVWNDVQNTLCGGNLINKRYVLTAAHCICVDDKGMQCDPNGEPKYNVKAHFSVYLGVNKMKVDNDNLGLKGDKKYQYGVEWTTAYIPMEKHHDIGLLRLDRDAEIAKNFLQPICLPSPDVSDIVSTQDFQAGRGLQVYVSGWGKLFSECITNQLGPVKGMKCRKQYKYLKKEYTDGCARTRPPGAKDEDCKAFKKKMKEDYPKKPGDSIKLVIGGTTKTCYKMTAHNGWCKTVSQGSPQASAPDTQWGWCVPLLLLLLLFLWVWYEPGMHGTELLGHRAGQGKGESLRGGAGQEKNLRGRGSRGKKVRKSTDFG